MTRLIVVDQNIPLGQDAFSGAGEVLRLPGREIRPEQVREAEALIVRSITRVDRNLLEGSRVRFVGTCTIGTDHLDVPWLESQGIAWHSAPGCNARSVAEWVVAALCLAHREGRIDLATRPRVGVVGAGRVGRQVLAALEAMGLPTLKNDPPRAEAEGPEGFVPLEELLEGCPVVCAHLPLTSDGAHPTRGLLDFAKLSRLPRGGAFLNAGRGPTSPSDGLRRLRAERPDLTLLLDVWDPEPAVPTDLAMEVLAGSPHVAGYSYEGKLEGTRVIRQELGRFLSLPDWSVPPQEMAPMMVPDSVRPGDAPWDALATLVLAAYDLDGDAARFRSLAALPDDERGLAFDRLRKEYPTRREFRNRPVHGWDRLPGSARDIASRLGFAPA